MFFHFGQYAVIYAQSHLSFCQLSVAEPKLNFLQKQKDGIMGGDKFIFDWIKM